jgi:hypothetical protein
MYACPVRIIQFQLGNCYTLPNKMWEQKAKFCKEYNLVNKFELKRANN